uniref:DNA helicase n=1 Tax=Ochrobactrum phage ORM_20 TaxID=2985243 RepID=A0A9N6WWW5_9VIRU|nr:DNA helicase [Ochrobactrum phage ORM_20]
MIDIIEEDILSCFPFEKPRDIQMEAIHEILQAYNEGYEHVVLDGPTGAGKSAIAIAVAKYIVEHTEEDEKALFTTISKYLQDQYLRDFPELASLRGSQDPIYTCDDNHLRSTEGCVLHMRQTNNRCIGECPYKKAQKRFLAGPYSLTNTHFIARLPRSWHMLIIDECHEAGNVVVGAAETPIFREDEVKFNLLFGEGSSRLVEIWREVRNSLENHSHGEVFEMPRFEGLSEFDVERAQKSVDALAGQPGFRSLKGHLAGLVRNMAAVTLTADKEVMYHFDPNEKSDKKDLEKSPVIKPVFASDFADKLLFSKGEFILHMSATICGEDAYARELGFEDHKWKAVRVRHPIPADRRKVYFNSIGWMSKKTEEKDFHKTAEFIDDLHKFYNKNIIIHTASYNRANRVRDLSFAPVDVPKSAKEAIAILKKGNVDREGNKTPAIVASPSIMAGVDGKDEICRINVIAKMPFPSFGDPRVRYISQKKPYLIAQQVVRHVVQAAGRGTRHEEDFSYTFIIDGMFDKLYKDNTQMFPEWFKDSIQWRYNGVLQPLPQEIAEFRAKDDQEEGDEPSDLEV